MAYEAYNYYLSLCTANCSIALQDPNCLTCGFDDSGMAICTECRAGYTAVDGQCTDGGMYLFDIVSWINHYECIFSPFLCIKMPVCTRE